MMNKAVEDHCYALLILGQSCEKENEIEKAVKHYEEMIELEFEGNFPYDRLCVLYRKMKRREDEERILLRAIDVFTNKVATERSDREPKLKKFKDRLAKLEAKP